MGKQLLIIGLLGVIILIFTAHIEPAKYNISKDTPVSEILKILGDETPKHSISEMIVGVSVEQGRSLVLKGVASKTSGGKTQLQSKHFVCTSCHNIQKEDPDLRYSNPEKRLEYVSKRGLPFLQGTTLYGVVNRTSYYNKDYYKKYGDLVYKAQGDLREAIQLCATECAQGRPLKDWELESILAYLWTLELKLSDLNMNKSEFKQLQERIDDKSEHPSLRAFVKSFYLQGSPATFGEKPNDVKKGYDFTGRPEKGKLVYDISCKHCHEKGRYSMFVLDDSKQTFKFLAKHFKKYTRYSTYHVTSYGTKPMPGKRAYMPNYTLEKLSHQQMEDLRAYFKAMSK